MRDGIGALHGNSTDPVDDLCWGERPVSIISFEGCIEGYTHFKSPETHLVQNGFISSHCIGDLAEKCVVLTTLHQLTFFLRRLHSWHPPFDF